MWRETAGPLTLGPPLTEEGCSSGKEVVGTDTGPADSVDKDSGSLTGSPSDLTGV